MKYNCSICKIDLHDQEKVYGWVPYVAPSSGDEVKGVRYYACESCHSNVLNARQPNERDFTPELLDRIREICFLEANRKMDSMHHDWRSDLALVGKMHALVDREFKSRTIR